MQLWIGPLALTRAWNQKMEWKFWYEYGRYQNGNGRFQERNGRQFFLLPYQFREGPQQLTASNADWLRRAILNIFLLSPEPSCPNPHFVMKSLRRNQCNETVGSRSVCLWSVDLAHFVLGFVHSNYKKTYADAR